MAEKRVTVNAGSRFGGLLAIAFIVLKLCDVITWSWWWVLSPLWIGFAIIGVVLAVIGIIYGIAALLDYLDGRSRRKKREQAE